jgi:hypothetical protein
MSATVFCPQCGTKNDPINGKKANFCCSCGNNLQSLTAFGGGSPSRASTSSRGPAMDIELGENTSSGRGSDEAGISKADVEIIGVAPTNKLQVGAILNTAQAGFSDARQPLSVKGKRVNGKKTFNEFTSEAGKGGTKGSEIG